MMNYSIVLIAVFVGIMSCNGQAQEENSSQHQLAGQQEGKIIKSEEEWKALLTDEEYYVTREKGTERAFTGKYNHHKEIGTYHCVCCGNPLFSSEAKFDSGTGWPSYFEPVGEENVLEHNDSTYGMSRTEVTCAKCDAHLGHVFEDGPEPTGLRYCINAVSLTFKK
jgi:peptide-methionine (R)-S-oxide reductase